MALKMDSSDKIAIIGYSGAGKTTLMEYLIKTFHFNMIVVDPVSRFSEKKHIRYVGKVKCKNPRKNKVCFKLRTEEQLEAIIEKLNDNDKEEIFLVVDEIDQYTTTRKLYAETSLYFQQGRNYHHGGMFSVRQVGRLNKQILSNCHYLFLFKILNEDDVEYLQQITGLALRKDIRKLGKHNFFIIDLHTSTILGKFYYSKKEHKILKDDSEDEE